MGRGGGKKKKVLINRMSRGRQCDLECIILVGGGRCCASAAICGGQKVLKLNMHLLNE